MEEENQELDILSEIINDNNLEVPASLERQLPLDKQKEFEECHWYYKYRIEIIKKILKNNIEGENLKILDIGVGTGTISKELENYGECTHIDISNEVIDFNQDLKISKENYPWESTKTLKDKYYDYIVIFNTLEYIENTKWTLEISKSKLKPNGKILITTLIGKDLSKEDIIYNMKRKFTYEDLKELITSLNLKIDTSSYFEGPYGGQIINSINYLFDEKIYSLNFIPRDNKERLNFYMTKELPLFGNTLIPQGKQIFLSLEKKTQEEIDENNKTKALNTKKLSFIDKMIGDIVQRRNEREQEREQEKKDALNQKDND